jgi:MoaA/NifB/PqqE/SkfB family radical SAM enzyme
VSETEWFSAVYQITQDCVFSCDICHRRYVQGETKLSSSERERMIKVLKGQGLKRLTITGGEPMLLGSELIDFLGYLHQQQIHVCLSTSGYRLSQSLLQEKMDQYLDQLLIPIRSLTLTGWENDFGGATRYTEETFYNVLNLLQWVKDTGIILYVSTVVHKMNIHRIINLGQQLFRLNPNIIWGVDDYYAMGKMASLNSWFELGIEESAMLRRKILADSSFENKSIYFNSAQSRKTAPDFFITPRGELVTTSYNRYSKPDASKNILDGRLTLGFQNRHNWAHYRTLCRDWGWGDLE